MKKLCWIAACEAMLLLIMVILTINPADAQSGWEYGRTITIDHTQIGMDLSDFPVLIDLSGEWLQYQSSGDPGHVRQPDGGDIRFTTSSLVQLDHEIETYDSTSGILVAWVRIPLLSALTDTQIYMWYGNADCEDQWNPDGVWDDHFVMVHHLAEQIGTHQDSTMNGYDGTPLGGIVQDAVGQVDGADEFDGIDARVDCGTGRARWSHQDQGYQRAVAKNGRIYVTGGGDHNPPSFHSYGFIFDLITGDLLLQSPSLGEFTFTASETGPVLDGNNVYLSPTKGNVSAWNTATNTIEWTTTGLSIWSSRMEFDGTYLYATTTDYKVVKIDTSNEGAVVASFDLDPDTDYENAVAPYLDEQENAVYALGASRLYKLTTSSLAESWNRDIGSGCLDSGSGHSRMLPIVVNDGFTGNEPWVIAGCWGNDTFYAYDSAGNLEWSKAITEGVRALASYSPNTGYLYIPSQGDKIYALDVADGRTQFVIDGADVPAGSGFGSPCTIADNYLIFKTMAGTMQYLYIFDAATGAYVTRYTLGTDLFLTCFPVAASQGYLITGGSLINYGGSDGGIFAVKAGRGQEVDYYPLHGPYRFGYIENALTDLDSGPNPVDQITLEAWTNIDEPTSEMNDHLVCRSSVYCLKFAQMPDDVPRFQLYDAISGWYNLDLTDTLTQSVWHHLAGTWDGLQMNLYVNGNIEASLNYTGTLNAMENSTFIGSYDGASMPESQSPDGRIDEVRISNVARSAEWIAAAHSNQRAPESFYALGPEQQADIDIAKLPDRQVVTGNSNATFTIVVSNTGALDLSDLTIRDPLTPDCDRTFLELSTGLAISYTCTLTNVTADFENQIAVTGTVVGTTDVGSTDLAVVDVLPSCLLSKTAEPTEIMEPGGVVTFTVDVVNTCSETVTLTSLVDSIHGDLQGQGGCVLPQDLEPAGDYTCSFAAIVSGSAGQSETDDVTAQCVDDEGNIVETSDGATVMIKAAPSVVVTPTSLAVSEPDGHATFHLSLTTEPTAAVTVPLATDNNECVVLSSSVTLHSTTWGQGVDVALSAVDDEIADGPTSCLILTGPASSTDSRFHLLNPEDVVVAVEDNDRAGIVVGPTIMEISEPDGSAAFTISAMSQPTASVSISLTTSNSQCSIEPVLASLDEHNWDTGLDITVSAVDDDVVDGDQTCVVQTAPAVCQDNTYVGLDGADVTVTVLDDDARGFIYLPLVMRNMAQTIGAPKLNSINNPEGDGSYTLNWTAIPEATGYVLQEASDGTFGNATQIYNGSDPGYTVTGRSTARYYYRVKAHRDQTESPWSNVEWVDVLWEQEPNHDPFSEANGPLVSGLTYYGTFTGTNDLNDYYFFDLLASHDVEVWLTNIASGHNYDLVLRDEALDSIGYSGELGNNDEYILAIHAPPGRYYIQVYHRSTGGTLTPYRLRVVYE